MAIRKTSVSPFSIYAFILWSVLYSGALWLLEQQFPDAAFFSNDNDAAFWVWIGGSIASMFCGWLLKNWLEKRLSERTFSLLELGMAIVALIAGLILYHFYAPEFLRIF